MLGSGALDRESLESHARPAWDHSIRALIALTVIVNLIYLGALLLPGDPASILVNIWLSLAAQWVPVGVFWLVGMRTGFARPEVVLAAAGVTFNAAGETYYALAMNSSGELPSPSPADIGYLLYYPFTLAALLVLVVRQSQGSMKSAMFDAAVASLGAAAVLAVILRPVFSDATSGASLLNGAIAALYPLFDILLITAVVAISASPVLRLGPRWQFLVVGFLLFAGADILYALLTHHGAYRAGTPLDAAWTAGVAFAAIWVDGVTRSSSEPRTAGHVLRAPPVPALAVVAGLTVLLVGTQSRVSVVALGLAGLTVLLAAFSVMSRHAALSRLLDGQERLVGKLRELDRAKSDIIHTMSHEMRTPLTSILGYVDLILDDEDTLPPGAAARLHVVEHHARRLQDLAADMSILERLEFDDNPSRSAVVAIGPMLRRAEALLRPLADSREVQLCVTADLRTSVKGDEGELEHALTSVIENAVKFTPSRGRVDVELGRVSGPDKQPRVVITVTDTGMGIPSDELPQIFDRFFRASNAQNQAVQGSGLGLAIVREIVQAHHGEVLVSSVLDEGTIVRVTLPTRREPADRD